MGFTIMTIQIKKLKIAKASRFTVAGIWGRKMNKPTICSSLTLHCDENQREHGQLTKQ
jgi:hypothetical protein